MQVPPTVPSLDDSKPVPASRRVLPGKVAWTLFAILIALLTLRLLYIATFRERVPLAAGITAAFALLAWLLEGVNTSGAAAGFVVTFSLIVTGGRAMFAAVLLVFALTYLATRVGSQRKRELRIAERGKGRDGAQVLANLGCAALAATLAHLTPWRLPLLAGGVASLAEAACDTVSSETGKAFARNARLVTLWKSVPAGTDGAISAIGTILGVAAGVIVASEVAVTNILPGRQAITALIAAIAGMFIDSILGATLERQGWLTNNGVNLVSTASAMIIATVAAQ